ncbi:Palmitoyl-protein thioesterase [Meyerozyma sp. JA9]|nr:Palmitoyl-protein thioesterase [Meyerozyma sp. JA9]
MRLDLVLALGCVSEPRFTKSPAEHVPHQFPVESQFQVPLQFPLQFPPQLPPKQTYRPVVVWHGLGDNYNSSGMIKSGEIIENKYPGIFVHRISLDSDPSKDQQMSIVGDAWDELASVCEQIGAIPELEHGFDMLGFSQGGLFSRALVQTCPNATVRNLITFGSPHMGVSELPKCANERDWLCKRRNELLKRQVWHDSVQRTVIPAQYFRDTYDYEKYVCRSRFLAPINNEGSSKHPEYKKRLGELEKFVMVEFGQDTTVNPKESAVFGEIDPVSGNVIPMEQTNLYKEDNLGLERMHHEGILSFLRVDGEHMDIPEEFFTGLVEQYLGK